MSIEHEIIEPTPKATYGNGATRSSGCPPLSMIPPEAERILARRCEAGLHHGFMNWKRGMPVAVIVDHIKQHLCSLALAEKDDDTGDTAESHIGAILWGGAALAWTHAHRPEAIKEYQSAHAYDGKGEQPANPYK